MKNKKAQTIFGLSFGAIFSIIIIIAIIGVGFFAIKHFLNLNKCTKIGFFYQDLQDEADRAWTSGIYRGDFKGELPSSGIFKTGVEQVCFGKLSQSSTSSLKAMLSNNYDFPDTANVFLYPPENACEFELASFNLKHVQTRDFFCIQVVNGVAPVQLEKDVSDSAVLLKR